MTATQFLDKKTISEMNKISQYMHNADYNGAVNIPSGTHREQVSLLFKTIDELVKKLGDQMSLGMLWCFGKGSNKSIEEHIEMALERYKNNHEDRLGIANKCHAHPSVIKKLPEKYLTKEDKFVILGLEIIFDATIGKYNLWIK